ncbi:MAG TPA: triose-phosphate isomerase [Methanomicrobiales archaeon]|nr:triose-phosphate isomerase [Methanomicrobiales archaeon]
MASPIIIVNFKGFHEGIGGRADLIARAARDVAAESGVMIAVAPVATEIHRISHHFEIPVYAQHVDGVSAGAHTGHITAEMVKLAGAAGTLINHSERRLTLADIEAAVRLCKEVDLLTVVCTNNDPTTAAAAALGPTYVAIEPPELIGGGVSVTKADPDIVRRSVEAVRQVNPSVKVLTGAGIQSGEDVKTAIELGTEGVLLASSVVKAKEPREVLRDLVSTL